MIVKLKTANNSKFKLYMQFHRIHYYLIKTKFSTALKPTGHWQRFKKMGFTCCITVMNDGEILDHFPVYTFVSQREWGVTSLVDWLCEDHHQQRLNDKHLLFGSTCLLMRALTIFRLPREHSMERGVSPASFTATVDTSKSCQFAVLT